MVPLNLFEGFSLSVKNVITWFHQKLTLKKLNKTNFQFVNLNILKTQKKKRKERTRLLIQKGALLDKYFETEKLSLDDTENLLKMFSNYVNSNKPEKYKKMITLNFRVIIFLLIYFFRDYCIFLCNLN